MTPLRHLLVLGHGFERSLDADRNHWDSECHTEDGEGGAELIEASVKCTCAFGEDDEVVARVEGLAKIEDAVFHFRFLQDDDTMAGREPLVET